MLLTDQGPEPWGFGVPVDENEVYGNSGQDDAQRGAHQSRVLPDGQDDQKDANHQVKHRQSCVHLAETRNRQNWRKFGKFNENFCSLCTLVRKCWNAKRDEPESALEHRVSCTGGTTGLRWRLRWRRTPRRPQSWSRCRRCPSTALSHWGGPGWTKKNSKQS